MALVAAAFIGMQIYMKRGVQGRLRDLADQISPKQYDPTDTTSNTTITRDGKSTEKTELSGNYTNIGNDTTTTSYDSTTVPD